jgi:Tol biopolymer transport system component/DNA-binding winged helix-turn-helix (wHTH) protein
VPTEETNPPAHLVRFSSFELDLRAGELRKHGLRVKLQEQPFQVLALLLKKPGEVVTREQLRERLWAADTFVDFDHSLNSAVKKLRQALNDDPDVPRFIETLPRRGYRFIGPVLNGEKQTQTGNASVHAQPAELPTPPAPAQPSSERGTHSWKIWAAGAFGFLLALSLAFWFRPRNAGLGNGAPIRLVPLTSYSGFIGKGSFSPDGNQIAFAWQGDQEDATKNASGIDIYVKEIGNEKLLRITENFGFNFLPAWSPDGRYIAFLHWNHNEPGGVYLVPALGGPPRKLAEPPAPTHCKPGLSWSADGHYLIFPFAADNQPCQIHRLNLEDLHIDSLTAPPVPSTGDWDAQYSPDGQSIAFIRNTKDVEDIYVMPAGGGNPRRVTFDNRLLSGLAWTPDSREVIFSSNRGGAIWGLWRVPVSGGNPERLEVGSEHAYMPSISRKGNRLSYASGVWNENIWKAEVGPDHRIRKFDRLIYSALQEEGPQYSPDGKRIVFQSTRSGSFEVWRADADGSNLVQLTSFGGPLTGTPRWSPDGRWISFDSRPGPHPNVYVISAEGGVPKRFASDFDEGVASWSRDGRWIYFASNRTGSWQVWKRPVDGGPPVQVTSSGGFAAFESPDGKELYYTRFSEAGIWKVAVDGGAESKVLDEPPAGLWGYFAMGEDGLYFVGSTGTPAKPRAAFKFLDFTRRNVITIGDMEKSPYDGAPGLTVSPDGRSLLYVQLDEGRNSLMLAENFR